MTGSRLTSRPTDSEIVICSGEPQEHQYSADDMANRIGKAAAFHFRLERSRNI